MTAMNGRTARTRHKPAEPAHALCAETQGRRIVAAMVNDAVEEALGLATGGVSGRQGGKTAPGELSRPAGKE